MDLSQGFPLYNNIGEVIKMLPPKRMSDIIEIAMTDGKSIPDRGDLILTVANNRNKQTTVIIDKNQKFRSNGRQQKESVPFRRQDRRR